jgi:hypothetical protein
MIKKHGHHASKVTLVLVIVATLIAIISLGTKGWYVGKSSVGSANYGLFEAKGCIGSLCYTSGLSNFTGSLESASYTAMFGLFIALIISVLLVLVCILLILNKVCIIIIIIHLVNFLWKKKKFNVFFV